MLNSKKAPEIVLDQDIASKILENVFQDNQVEPNSIPLEVLTSYSSYRKERFALQRTILIIMMVLFLMLPFLFVAPSFSIDTNDKEYTSTPVYNVDVDSFMPISRITATIDGHNTPVYEVDAHKYSIEPSVNGKMKVTVTLINKQKTTRYVDVTCVDMEVPVLVSSRWDDENVYLTLSDTGSGINFSNITASDINGNTVSPVSTDASKGLIVFKYPTAPINVYIPDNAGNSLQLALSLK